MVDAATQYSPPQPRQPTPTSTRAASTTTTTTQTTATSQTPTSTIAGLQLSEGDDSSLDTSTPALSPAPPPPDNLAAPKPLLKSDVAVPQSQSKRHAVDPASATPLTVNGNHQHQESDDHHYSPIKKPRPDAPPVRKMPLLYEDCNTRDLVVLISSMLMELIRYNDAIPLREGHLTRFHSRAPPGISVLDYLQRLTTHATLSPPILLSMVYYIDRLCTLYPAFTITSLTVHRFLITSATVASKGLSDSFWTNKTYARVGGVSMKELALLELEFLTKMEWRIVPKPEVLCDYYKSLIGRNSQYELEM
ncbi:phosphate system cyclin PHO80 [Exophiala aquamarina CBS 119918]|uniref:Phosphate system cyclin PHO80 n=1 Tax=Exophiala aquamarina CBS 119918 TaxID=1182545 RepID=A0A072NV46_9EURO|nr:phosphate system cyclin PHO80 [Exophiala aquamarina CBS 119918]KEF51247.1 phosphate system cyclin PHO80 [Exophiala aquamarina CBS 119918]